ncbi:trimethyllysine dioxygenase, mitochondrial-like [Ostrea edulis]|uniref:trimethyllysine dioxygenase, mitochondrial-like n=1 Tax=Ostrea edulis TaxID=37623 RepID=UPI0020962F53|nr:trimethyllysine dioxygenase, mitochondrial-like [Ostrea edulis]XP_048746300.1 trimethyllysine dioxygenase, mitochondrial-like [Ostrea edulis]XP_056004707.1 trimethyllysine dioxygenase, mitochondrial-like [Ostrea edulis]XP_056004709.1 trimethyllysine dioxygenase, mitochondrial-like [Ostrea edulis]
MSGSVKLLQRIHKSNILRLLNRSKSYEQISSLHSYVRKSSALQKRHLFESRFKGSAWQYAAQRSHVSSVSLQGSRNKDVTLNQEGLLLCYGHYNLDLPYVWLRDHCRCDVCYNHETCQKNVDNYKLDLDIKPTLVTFDGTVLTLEWPDKHLTSYNIDWLLENSYHDQHNDRVEKLLWNKDVMTATTEQPMVPCKDFMHSESGLKAHVKNLLKFGFSIVTEVPADHKGTLAVSQRLTFIQPTLFGPSWTFTSNMAFGDTAYTTLGLKAHTDNTYFMAPSGIQVFHVLEHNGTGGETLLVDGFHVAETLRRNNPAEFECLAETVVPHEFYDKEHRVRSLGTVLTLHPTTKELLSIRYNPYDRSPLHTVPPNQIRRFYKSYAALSEEIGKTDNEFWIKLKPGMVLFVDNWRVMHGRSAFIGQRRVSGCYLPRDDWFGQARLLGFQNL